LQSLIYLFPFPKLLISITIFNFRFLASWFFIYLRKSTTTNYSSKFSRSTVPNYSSLVQRRGRNNNTIGTSNWFTMEARSSFVRFIASFVSTTSVMQFYYVLRFFAFPIKKKKKWVVIIFNNDDE
jgi:hypothetical protein